MNSFLVVLFAFFAFTGCSCESDKVYGPPPDTEGRASVDMSSDAFEAGLDS